MFVFIKQRPKSSITTSMFSQSQKRITQDHQERAIIYHHHHHHQAPPESTNHKDEPRVLYNPRTIHVSPDNFKDLVQRLTGKPPDNDKSTEHSRVSPAARFASIERTISKKKERFSWSSRDEDMMKKMLEDSVQMGPFPGILSSEPSALPPISSENFMQVALQPIPSDNISQSQVTMSPISSENFLPVTYPPTPSNIFSPETLPPIQLDIFSPATMPLMPSEYFTPVSMPLKPLEFFQSITPSEFLPPVITPTRPSEFFSTVFSYNDVCPENSISASSSDISPAAVVPPQTPPNMFNPFDSN